MKKRYKKIKQNNNIEHMLGTPESRLIASLKDEKPAKAIVNNK